MTQHWWCMFMFVFFTSGICYDANCYHTDLSLQCFTLDMPFSATWPYGALCMPCLYVFMSILFVFLFIKGSCFTTETPKVSPIRGSSSFFFKEEEKKRCLMSSYLYHLATSCIQRKLLLIFIIYVSLCNILHPASRWFLILHLYVSIPLPCSNILTSCLLEFSKLYFLFQEQQHEYREHLIWTYFIHHKTW